MALQPLAVHINNNIAIHITTNAISSMRPPRLFMFYFLRSKAAAIAILNSRRSLSGAATCWLSKRTKTSLSSHSNHDDKLSGHIVYRLALPSDISQIHECNLATLPENYNTHFYVNHLRQWPELAMVAELVPDEAFSSTSCIASTSPIQTQTQLSSYSRGTLTSPTADTRTHTSITTASRPRNEIVGYILGKVEHRPILTNNSQISQRQWFPPSKVPLFNEDPTLFHHSKIHNNWNKHNNLPWKQQDSLTNTSPWYSTQHRPPPKWESLGHVTSLAVHPHARRLGIASSLLHQLHYHLYMCYNAQSVGLHVRISNKAAVKLYMEQMGYDVRDIVPRYYGDGEDAYFMRKDLRTISDGEEDAQGFDRNNANGQRNNSQGSFSVDQRAGKRQDERKNTSELFLSGKIPRSFRSLIGTGRERDHNQFVSNRKFDTLLSRMDGASQSNTVYSRKSNRSDDDIGWQNKKVMPWETGPNELRLPRYTKIEKQSMTLVQERNVNQQVGIKLSTREKEYIEDFEEAHVASGTV